MATTNINVRTDSEIKSAAQAIFASLGLDMSTAINIFLRQTVRQNDIPFVLTTTPAPKKKTREEKFDALRGNKMVDDFDAPLEDF